jgi:hypothetical protein
MRKWLYLAPVLLLAGCAKTDSPANTVQASGAPDPFARNQPASSTSAPAPAIPPAGSSSLPAAASDTNVAPASPVVPLTIPSGTTLNVRLDERIDTRQNRAGDGFSATLSRAIQSDGKVLVPEGTVFTGHVTTAQSSGRLKGRAVLGLKLDGFTLAGRQYAIRTGSIERVSDSHKKRNGILIGGGTALGAAIGGIAGGGKGALIGAGAGAGAGTAGAAATGKREEAVAAEAPLRFTLKAPVEL